jgi:cytoskeletal protein RodZ
MKNLKHFHLKKPRSSWSVMCIAITFTLLSGCGSNGQVTNAQPQANSEQLTADKNQSPQANHSLTSPNETIPPKQEIVATEPNKLVSETKVTKFETFFPYIVRPIPIVANDQMKQELQDAKNLWAATGGERYQLTQFVQVGHQFYGANADRPFYTTNFVGNSAVAVTEFYGEVAYPIASADFAQARVKSIEQLFALVEDAYKSSEYTISVMYNQLFGYPEYIYIDYAPRGADGFAVHQSTDLKLKP